MALKRKRSVSDPDQQCLGHQTTKPPKKSIKTSPLPARLTRGNLQKLQESITITTASTTDGVIMPARSPAKSSSRASTVPSSDPGRSLAVLNAYSIHVEGGHCVMSPGVQALVDRISVERPVDKITPKSSRIAKIQSRTKEMTEPNAGFRLVELLTYKDKLFEDDEEGEDMVFIGKDDQWADCIHKPLFAIDTELGAALQELGAPPRPKPDYSHGYPDRAFSKKHQDARNSLDQTCFLTRREPWFPWLVLEMKGQQALAAAQRQAARDAATAISAFHSTLSSLTQVDPQPEETAMFSLCNDANVFELRVHWRYVDNDGEVSWQAHIFAEGLLRRAEEVYQLRSKILNILNWARTTRWQTLESALEQRVLRRRNAPTLPSPASSLGGPNPGAKRPISALGATDTAQDASANRG